MIDLSDPPSVRDSPPVSPEYNPDNDPDLTPERTERVLAPSHIETPNVDANGRRTTAVNLVRNIIDYSPLGADSAIGGRSPKDRPNIRAHVVPVEMSKKNRLGRFIPKLGLPKTDKFNVNTAFNQFYLSIELHDLFDYSHKLCIVPIRRKENGEIELLPQLRKVWRNNTDSVNNTDSDNKPIRYDSKNGLPQFDDNHVPIHYEYAVLPTGALDSIEIYFTDPDTGKVTSKFVDLYETLVTFKSHCNPMFFTWNAGWHIHYWEEVLGEGNIPFWKRLKTKHPDWYQLIIEIADLTRDLFKDEPKRRHQLSAEDKEMYLEIVTSATDMPAAIPTPSSPASLDMYTDDNSIADLLDPEFGIDSFARHSEDDSAKFSDDDHDKDDGPAFSSPTRNPRSNVGGRMAVQSPGSDYDEVEGLLSQESSNNESSGNRGLLDSSPPPESHSRRPTEEEVEPEWDGSEDRNGNVNIPDDSVLDSDGEGAGLSAREGEDSGTERGEDSDSDGEGDEGSGGRTYTGAEKGKGRDTEGDRDEESGSDGEGEDDVGDGEAEEESDTEGEAEDDAEGGDDVGGDSDGDDGRGRQRNKRSRAASDSSDDRKTPKPAAKKARPKPKRKPTQKRDSGAYRGPGPSSTGPQRSTRSMSRRGRGG